MHAFVAFCDGLGWPGLALLAFVASTIVPIGSEWLLAIQLAHARSAGEQLFLVLVATLANTLGGATTYGLGRAGIALSKRDPMQTHPRVARWVTRYGSLAGLATWAPIVGDPCAVLCGVLRVRFLGFLIFSLFGRCVRYAAIWGGVVGLWR